MLFSRVLLNQFIVVAISVLALCLPSEFLNSNNSNLSYKDQIFSSSSINGFYSSNRNSQGSSNNDHRDSNPEDEYLKNEKKESKENIFVEIERITTFYESLISNLSTLEQFKNKSKKLFSESIFINFILKTCFLFTNSSPPISQF
jgi:hypothetical protein